MLDKNKKITIELIAHYPQENPNFGTFHAYWEEMDMDLRGCTYILKPKVIMVRFPTKKTKDNGKDVYYNTLCFVDQEYNKKFIKALRKSFQEYAKENKIVFQNINPATLPKPETTLPTKKPFTEMPVRRFSPFPKAR